MCNAEQDSASGCMSKEGLWREVLALSMETWVICTAGTCRPLRAAFVQRDRDGGCCARRCLVQHWKILVGYWKVLVGRWWCPASEHTGSDRKADTKVSERCATHPNHLLNLAIGSAVCCRDAGSPLEPCCRHWNSAGLCS